MQVTNKQTGDVLENKVLELLHSEDKGHEFCSVLLPYLARKNIDYSRIESVIPCGGNNQISKILGEKHKQNPSDVLLKLDDGSFFGISLKSTKRPDRISLKNLGLGTIYTYLGFDHNITYNLYIQNIMQLYNLDGHQDRRKKQIRSNPELADQINAQGDSMIQYILNHPTIGIRNLYSVKSLQDNKRHFLEDWFSCSADSVPYVAVIECDGKYTIEDYKGDHRIKLLKNTKNLNFSCSGNSVIVSCDEINIFRMRLKFTSQKLASSLKFSGELI